MNNKIELIIYIEFDSNIEEASSNPLKYNFVCIPRIGETVFFDHRTYSLMENEYVITYLKTTNTKIRDYSRVIDVRYEMDSETVFIILGYSNKS